MSNCHAGQDLTQPGFLFSLIFAVTTFTILFFNISMDDLGLGSIQVDRKLVKQTVMTSVYGVTYVGAREQIKRRLEERGFINDEKLLYRVSCYAAKVSLLLFRLVLMVSIKCQR